MEMSGDDRCSRIRLSSTHADRVITFSDDGTTVLGDHTQVTVFQCEMDILAAARFEMNALKSAQSNERRALDGRELEVDLHYLVPGNFAGVCNRHLYAERLARVDGPRWNGEVAVAEGCVTETIAKRIERLAVEVAISTVRHPVILEVGQLADAGIESYWQATRGIVLSAQGFSHGRSALFAGIPCFEDGVGMPVDPVDREGAAIH